MLKLVLPIDAYVLSALTLPFGYLKLFDVNLDGLFITQQSALQACLSQCKEVVYRQSSVYTVCMSINFHDTDTVK